MWQGTLAPLRPERHRCPFLSSSVAPSRNSGTLCNPPCPSDDKHAPQNVIPRVSPVGCVHENVSQKNTHIWFSCLLHFLHVHSLHFNLRCSVHLFEEPHRVPVVDGQPKPRRIRFTTQLVDLGYGNNDANLFFLIGGLRLVPQPEPWLGI